jgi:hypothetical protein
MVARGADLRHFLVFAGVFLGLEGLRADHPHRPDHPSEKSQEDQDFGQPMVNPFSFHHVPIKRRSDPEYVTMPIAYYNRSNF